MAFFSRTTRSDSEHYCAPFFLIGSLLAAACNPAAEAVPAREPPPAAAPLPPRAAASDDARGARLYDNWRKEKRLDDAFVPDSPKTPELDGKGGPSSNGTLNDADGRALPNTGHDYRLKNFFGWDLRGTSGVYGPTYQNKATALPRNLLEDARSEAELRAWLTQGGEGLPAYGPVLDQQDVLDLIAFLTKTRAGLLAGPAAVFRLEPKAPKGYALNSGGDAARGRERFSRTCAECHGKDGRAIAIDETESVGSLARTAGYEVWFKMLHGQPGSKMGRQVSEADAPGQAQALLDLFSALCDRKAFPAPSGTTEVPDGDARCDAYLR